MTGLSTCTWFPPVSVVALVLHNHLYLSTVLIRWLSSKSWEPLKNAVPFLILQSVGQRSTFTVLVVGCVLCVVCEMCALGDKTVLINRHVHCKVWAEAETTVEY